MYLGFDKCILCFADGPLSDEHVVPLSLGGHLKMQVICESCNNGLGAKLVAGLFDDPGIRLAVEKVRGEVPDFTNNVGSEKFFFAKVSDGQLLRLSRKGKSERILPAHIDGELAIQDVREIPATLEGRLKKAGAPMKRIEEVLQSFRTAANDERVSVPELGIEVVKRTIPTLQLDLGHKAKELDVRLPVMMAYEFLAVAAGTAIYDTMFEPIRQFIRTGADTKTVSVESLLSDETEPIHYLNLLPMPGEGVVKVDVGFFRSVVFRVRFNVPDGLEKQLIYEENLKAGTSRFGFRDLDSENFEVGWLIPPKGNSLDV